MKNFWFSFLIMAMFVLFHNLGNFHHPLFFIFQIIPGWMLGEMAWKADSYENMLKKRKESHDGLS